MHWPSACMTTVRSCRSKGRENLQRGGTPLKQTAAIQCTDLYSDQWRIYIYLLCKQINKMEDTLCSQQDGRDGCFLFSDWLCVLI